MPKSATLASLCLLLLLPLWYSPLTQSLALQKNVLVSLGLCFAASSAGPWSALFLFMGAALSVLFPQGTAVLLPLFSLPLLVSFFRQHPAGRWLWASASLVALLALLQGLGLDLFRGSTDAFHLPYRVLTASLGNPNYLALFLLFAVLSLAVPGEAREAPDRRALLWGALLLGVVAWSRSFLAWVLLSLLLWASVARYQKKVALAFGLASPILVLAFFCEGLWRALEGRLYLAWVHLSAVSSEVWIRGVGPGQEASAFLHWQAAFLQDHPAQLRFWSYPEYAHNDLISVAVTWGVPITVLLLWLVYSKNRVVAATSNPNRLLIVASVLLASLGATILYVTPVLVVASALLAKVTEPIAPRTWRYSRWVARLAALVLLAMTSLQASNDWHLTRAAQAGMAHQYEAAQQALDAAKTFPFQPAQLLFLQGRLYLEQQRFAEAKEPLQQALLLFPHPEVFRPLAFVCMKTDDHETLSQVLAQWRIYAPNDKALEKFKDF